MRRHPPSNSQLSRVPAGAGTATLPPRRTASISVVLTGGFALLVLLAVAAVLFLGTRSALRSTEQLVSEKATLVVDAASERIIRHLVPAREQAEYLAALVAEGIVDSNDVAQLWTAMQASLAAVPQVTSIVYISASQMGVSAQRESREAPEDFENWSAERNVVDALSSALHAEEAFWGEVVWSGASQKVLLNMRVPVRRDGRLIGVFVSLISIDDLSRYLARVTAERGAVPFILLGPNEVLAHPSYEGGVTGRSTDAPLPTLHEVGDPILASIWNDTERTTRDLQVTLGSGVEGHVVETGRGKGHVFLYRRIYGFGAEPWMVGVYSNLENIKAEFERIQKVVLAGLAVMILAVISAVVIGRWISRPVRELAEAASVLRTEGPDAVTTLGSSPFTELSVANRAFNEMAEGLREREMLRDTFGKYVPESVAEAIIKDRGILEAQTRTATILFTDIVGFSTVSETMAPSDLVAMLNDYFAVIGEPVERNGGVIQQFQGDAILATFNLPIADPEHARRAVLTALEIQRVLVGRKFGPGIELPTRVGINTGTVVGGTVGSGGRLGYTVHGDNVNVAARLEQLNKQYGTRILVSESTVELAGDGFDFELIGELPIRGRQSTVAVYTIKASPL